MSSLALPLGLFSSLSITVPSTEAATSQKPAETCTSNVGQERITPSKSPLSIPPVNSRRRSSASGVPFAVANPIVYDAALSVLCHSTSSESDHSRRESIKVELKGEGCPLIEKPKEQSGDYQNLNSVLYSGDFSNFKKSITEGTLERLSEFERGKLLYNIISKWGHRGALRLVCEYGKINDKVLINTLKSFDEDYFISNDLDVENLSYEEAATTLVGIFEEKLKKIEFDTSLIKVIQRIREGRVDSRDPEFAQELYQASKLFNVTNAVRLARDEQLTFENEPMYCHMVIAAAREPSNHFFNYFVRPRWQTLPDEFCEHALLTAMDTENPKGVAMGIVDLLCNPGSSFLKKFQTRFLYQIFLERYQSAERQMTEAAILLENSKITKDEELEKSARHLETKGSLNLRLANFMLDTGRVTGQIISQVNPKYLLQGFLDGASAGKKKRISCLLSSMPIPLEYALEGYHLAFHHNQKEVGQLIGSTLVEAVRFHQPFFLEAHRKAIHNLHSHSPSETSGLKSIDPFLKPNPVSILCNIRNIITAAGFTPPA